MKVPLKLFWFHLRSMYRIQAQENLRWVRVLSMPNITEQAREDYVNEQVKAMGIIQVSEERDTEGFNKLKNL